MDPTCPVCAALLKQAADSVRAHLRAIGDLEQAVRESWTDRILSAEAELATLRELSDDDAWRYRAHCAFSHTLPPSPGVTVNTSHAV